LNATGGADGVGTRFDHDHHSTLPPDLPLLQAKCDERSVHPFRAPESGANKVCAVDLDVARGTASWSSGERQETVVAARGRSVRPDAGVCGQAEISGLDEEGCRNAEEVGMF
jgi:hypothetical protein